MPAKALENSNPRLLISEVLRKVSNAKTKKEKIALLQKHNSQALRSLLIWNFDESVISMAVSYTHLTLPTTPYV